MTGPILVAWSGHRRSEKPQETLELEHFEPVSKQKWGAFVTSKEQWGLTKRRPKATWPQLAPIYRGQKGGQKKRQKSGQKRGQKKGQKSGQKRPKKVAKEVAKKGAKKCAKKVAKKWAKKGAKNIKA